MLTKTERALESLSSELQAGGLTGEVVLVGGAALVLLLDAREATRDVDAISLRPRDSVEAAAKNVAAALSLPIDWLNARAQAFAMEVSEGPVVFRAPNLIVRTASVEQLLAMKLSAMRDSVDYADARMLLAALAGAKEELWENLQRYLDPSMPEWKRQNFDALWGELHGRR